MCAPKWVISWSSSVSLVVVAVVVAIVAVSASLFPISSSLLPTRLHLRSWALTHVAAVVDDFQARSSDELTLAKGDRVELIERDDEFGDGWFLGRHLINGNSGLFPEGAFPPLVCKSARLRAALPRLNRARQSIRE